MKVAILGFGREGQSVLRFLQNRGLAQITTQINADNTNRGLARMYARISADRKNELYVLDKNPRVTIPHGAHARLGKNYLKHLDQFDVIFRSPGIPYNLPELVRARRAGIQMSSATKLFFDEAKKRNVTIIGITGSKGKTTTATLLYKMLKASGKNVFLAGNIGTPVLNVLPRLSASSPRRSAFIVLELSSFQLQDLQTSPHIAVVLDIFPEHQDSHGSLREYYDAKANIARYQKKSDTVFFFGANRLSRRIAKESHGQKIPVSGKTMDFNEKDISLVGRHMFKNTTMAATVAAHLGVPQTKIVYVLKKFHGVKHRLQLVRTITIRRRYAGKPYSNVLKNIRIRFYDDSASHNPHAAAAAVRSFSNEKVILVAGGKDRPSDYRPLKDALQKSAVAAVVLFGENKKKIAQALHGIKNKELRIKVTKDLQTAVSTTYKIAVSLQRKTKNLQLVCVLLSPGAPSYDMFKNFEERGDAFVKYVRKLK